MPKYPARTYEEIDRNKIDSSLIREKLKLRQFAAKESLNKKHPHVYKYLINKGIDLGKIREHSARILSAGALTGTLLLTPPMGAKTLPSPTEIIESIKTLMVEKVPDAPQKLLIDLLSGILPERPRSLNKEEEQELERIFEQVIGIKTKANLEGEHLNTTYGYIGAEQHLRRYPGDTMAGHKPFLKEGMAPGLGAWGYFAYSKDKLDESLIETEKWYAVVQTLYLPDWNTRTRYLRDWYRYRKVLIVNTKSANAVVAAIADSGPAAWTGKHFGGSPEVMEYLGGPRYKKGAVVIFFVDDPENKVPLGPVDYNQINLSKLALTNI
ncbi:MAG: hypothetical protein Q8P91_02030 [bacterium]|nr:hypothetical protein [bacterium]